VSQPIFGKNYLSYGALLTVNSSFNDRDAYFIKYDQTFYNSSVSLKLLHLDYRYIASGKNIISLDYNSSFNIGHSSLFYFVGGLYYRVSLNSWNQPSWSPINYNSEDKEYFPEILFGAKIELIRNTFVTLDLNNRDIFNAVSGDNVALDFSANYAPTPKFTLRFIISNRFTGLLGGNGDIGQQDFLLGAILPL
jgi:hypothetical protein